MTNNEHALLHPPLLFSSTPCISCLLCNSLCRGLLAYVHFSFCWSILTALWHLQSAHVRMLAFNLPTLHVPLSHQLLLCLQRGRCGQVQMVVLSDAYKFFPPCNFRSQKLNSSGCDMLQVWDNTQAWGTLCGNVYGRVDMPYAGGHVGAKVAAPELAFGKL